MLVLGVTLEVRSRLVFFLGEAEASVLLSWWSAYLELDELHVTVETRHQSFQISTAFDEDDQDPRGGFLCCQRMTEDDGNLDPHANLWGRP